jgi:hypothetical protein
VPTLILPNYVAASSKQRDELCRCVDRYFSRGELLRHSSIFSLSVDAGTTRSYRHVIYGQIRLIFIS